MDDDGLTPQEVADCLAAFYELLTGQCVEVPESMTDEEMFRLLEEE